ncbi:MAG: acyl-ACP thioesterase domain-containing protein [Opitutaceae bacterium]|jgi:acyl-ACP thioesterase
MSDTFHLDSTVSFWNVDRDQTLTLTGVFKLLQEGAIKHADLYDVGSRAMLARGESWVLNRMSAAIHRYPRYEESLHLETWSSGIRGFKGYREFRLRAGEELLVSASSLWLYLNVKNKVLTRVPSELAESFPERGDNAFHPDIDKLRLVEPVAPTGSVEVSVRYSDIDSNGHVNNAAYFDYLQTALARLGEPVRPARIELQFAKEIPPTLDLVKVDTQKQDNQLLFRVGSETECFAKGRLFG